MRKMIKRFFTIVRTRLNRKNKRNANDIILAPMLQGDLFKHIREISLKPLAQGVVLYARVANNENNGLSKQIADLENEAELVGDTDISIYSEVASGISKNEIERSELYRLIRDAEKGLVKRLYIKCRDRISRDVIFTREIAVKLNNYGVELIEVQ